MKNLKTALIFGAFIFSSQAFAESPRFLVTCQGKYKDEAACAQVTTKALTEARCQLKEEMTCEWNGFEGESYVQCHGHVESCESYFDFKSFGTSERDEQYEEELKEHREALETYIPHLIGA